MVLFKRKVRTLTLRLRSKFSNVQMYAISFICKMYLKYLKWLKLKTKEFGVYFFVECPLDWVVLPDMTSAKVRCGMSSNCTRIDCCVDFSLLNLKLHFFLHFDRCHYVISGGIEKKTFSFGLLDFNESWGMFFKITSI